MHVERDASGMGRLSFGGQFDITRRVCIETPTLLTADAFKVTALIHLATRQSKSSLPPIAILPGLVPAATALIFSLLPDWPWRD